MSRENAVHSTGVTPGWYGVDPETMDLKADPHERTAAFANRSL